MNCYKYTALNIIHTIGMDNEIVKSNSYTIIASIRRYFQHDYYKSNTALSRIKDTTFNNQ